AASRPRRLLDVPFAIPTAVLGAGPWLAFNLRNDWASLHEKPIPVATSYPERLEEFFTELIPRLLNLKTYWGEWVFGGTGKVLYVALLAGVLALAGWCVLRPEGRRSRLVPFPVLVAGYPFLFAVPTASFYVDEPRYGLFLAPTIALLLAAGLVRVLRRPAAQLAAVGVVAALSAAGVGALVNFADRYPGHHDLGPVRTDELATELEGRGITTLRADYWIAYALTFEARERVVATPVATVRYQPYERRFRESGSTAHVFFPDSPEEQHFVKEIVSKGSGWRREVIADDFVLYTGGHATP
ncbi:MAG TPA: hypothetical protein VI854_01400, partial [Acidimicrobiia bacterium]|nr:hypothetical protein [Acidimicrobiia bacterium]